MELGLEENHYRQENIELCLLNLIAEEVKTFLDIPWNKVKLAQNYFIFHINIYIYIYIYI